MATLAPLQRQPSKAVLSRQPSKALLRQPSKATLLRQNSKRTLDVERPSTTTPTHGSFRSRRSSTRGSFRDNTGRQYTSNSDSDSSSSHGSSRPVSTLSSARCLTPLDAPFSLESLTSTRKPFPKLELESLDSPHHCLQQMTDLCFGSAAPISTRLSPLRSRRSRPNTAKDTTDRRSSRSRPATTLGFGAAPWDEDDDSDSDSDEENRLRDDSLDKLSFLSHHANNQADHMLSLLELAAVDSRGEDKAIDTVRPDTASFADTLASVWGAIDNVNNGLKQITHSKKPEAAVEELKADVKGKPGTGMNHKASMLPALTTAGRLHLTIQEQEAADFRRAMVNASMRFQLKLRGYREDKVRLETLKTRVNTHNRDLKTRTTLSEIVQKNKALSKEATPEHLKQKLEQERELKHKRMVEARLKREAMADDLLRKKELIEIKELERQERLKLRKMVANQRVWIRTFAIATRLHLIASQIENGRFIRRTQREVVDPAVVVLKDFLLRINMRNRIRYYGKSLLLIKRCIWRRVCRVRINHRHAAVFVIKDFLRDQKNMKAAAVAVRQFRNKVVRLQRFIIKQRAVDRAQLFMLHRQWEKIEAEMKITHQKKKAKKKKKPDDDKKEEKKGKKKKKKDGAKKAFGIEIAGEKFGLVEHQNLLNSEYSLFKSTTIQKSFDSRKRSYKNAMADWRMRVKNFVETNRDEINLHIAKAVLHSQSAADTPPTPYEIATTVLKARLPERPARCQVCGPRVEVVAQINVAISRLKENEYLRMAQLQSNEEEAAASSAAAAAVAAASAAAAQQAQAEEDDDDSADSAD